MVGRIEVAEGKLQEKCRLISKSSCIEQGERGAIPLISTPKKEGGIPLFLYTNSIFYRVVRSGNKMYFITCFERLPPEGNCLDIGACRCFGYKETYEEAVEALHENSCDMFETIYMYAIIEKLGPYIHPFPEMKQYFKYDFERDGFFEIDEPESTKNLSNFSLG